MSVSHEISVNCPTDPASRYEITFNMLSVETWTMGDCSKPVKYNLELNKKLHFQTEYTFCDFPSKSILLLIYR